MVRSSNMLINVSLVLIVLGFLTSVFNIWDVLDSEVTSKLYATYFVLLGTALYGKVLYDIEGELTNMQKVIWANYGMVALVAMLLLGLIYSSEASELLSGFYGRLLAASSITAATLSIVIAIQQHLFYQKHPELKQKRRHSAGKIILIVVLVIIFVPTLISMILSAALYSRY